MLNMEVPGSFEMSVLFYQITCYHISECCNLYVYSRLN